MGRIMKFNTSYNNRPVYTGEENSGELVTERAGFIPMKKRIEEMILSGERLANSRSEAYDFQDGKDDGSSIPVDRNLDYDLADASSMLNTLDSRFNQQKLKETEDTTKEKKQDELSNKEEVLK